MIWGVLDHTGMDIYYRSIQQRRTDRLSTLDYLWRWDTDWFWCSRAMGCRNRRSGGSGPSPDPQ